ncbi:50S ribosomal protein L31 [Candidatus Microgenomates bacterium]|jgi:large subunit ribosomal protein L31|nr:50S ribosomal protein L31 [Candidatus Microgenomates bacterium]
MKKDIHPKYNNELVITCSCGNKITTGSTLPTESLSVEICSKCHPFYTGEQKIVDTDNLVKKYEEKLEKSKSMSFRSKKQKMEERRKKLEKVSNKPSSALSLRDMLENARISK